jgi:cytochrome P450
VDPAALNQGGALMLERHDLEAGFLNIYAPAFQADPIPVLTTLQQRCWYARTANGYWLLRHDQARALLREPRLHGVSASMLTRFGVTDGPFLQWFTSALPNLEGRRHETLRHLLSPLFAPARMQHRRDAVRRVVAELVNQLPDQDSFDFVERISDVLPVRVLCSLLGVPAGDHEPLRVWAADLSVGFGPGYIRHKERVEAAIVEVYDYVGAMLDRPRRLAPDSLVRQLAVAQGAAASRDELRSAIVTLLFAAHTTLRNQLSQAILTFLRHPAQWLRLGRDPTLAGAAAEEVMRFAPPVPVYARRAVTPFRFRDLDVDEGTIVGIAIAITNRDPMVFHNPHAFDITPRRESHLTFGHGVHFCLGAALARIELQEALAALARRLPGLALTQAADSLPPIGAGIEQLAVQANSSRPQAAAARIPAGLSAVHRTKHRA